MKDKLSALLDDLDNFEVECDGMARLVMTRLYREGISCVAMAGTLHFNGKAVHPHFWIETDDYLIDYRARMWLPGEDGVPHGVHAKGEVDGLYHGVIYPEIRPLSDALFSILATPIRVPEVEAPLLAKPKVPSFS